MAAAAREKFMAMQAEQQPMLASRTLSTNSSLKGGKGSSSNLIQQAQSADPLATTLPSNVVGNNPTGPTASPTPVEFDADKRVSSAGEPQVSRTNAVTASSEPVAVNDTGSIATKPSTTTTATSNVSAGATAAAAPSADPNAAIIALGWQVHNDKKTGRDYYFNPVTKETKWQRPTVDGSGASTKQAAPIATSFGTDTTASVTSAKNIFESKSTGAATNASTQPPNATGSTPQQPNTKASAVSKAPPPLAPAAKGTAAFGDNNNTMAPSSPFGATQKFGNNNNKNSAISNIAKGSPAAANTTVGKDSKKTTNPLSFANNSTVAASDATSTAAVDQSDALKALLEQNRQLQAMIAAGMNGPIALDFGGKLDALTKTNSALTIQINRLQTEHAAMLKALTEANVKVHQLQQQIEEERAINTSRLGGAAYASNSAMSLTKDGEASEVGVAMAHLRETNRNLVQQVGELSTLLARSLADQSFVAAASMGGGTASAERRDAPSPLNNKDIAQRPDGNLDAAPLGSSIPAPDLINNSTSYYPGYQVLMKSNPLAAVVPPSSTNMHSPSSPMRHHLLQQHQQQAAGLSSGPPFPQSYLNQGPTKGNSTLTNYQSAAAADNYHPQYDNIYDNNRHHNLQPRSSSIPGSRRSASPPFAQPQQQGFNHPVLRSGSAYGTRSPSLGGRSGVGQQAGTTGNALLFGGVCNSKSCLRIGEVVYTPPIAGLMEM